MIKAVRQKLVEMGKACCEIESLHGQEKGKGVILKPSSNGEAIKIKVDGCLIADKSGPKKCDCLYFYAPSQGKRHVFLVELKGTNYADALEQLADSSRHANIKSLLDAANLRNPTAVAIVGEKARTNRPRKDEWENVNKLRLKVIPLADDKTYDLTGLIEARKMG